MFDKSDLEEENDIYFLEGFFKPGTHQIIIYDPELNSFFKRENIFVAPRTIDLKQLKTNGGANFKD